MRFAQYFRRVDVGLLLAIPLVAIGPLVASAQNGFMVAGPQGYPAAANQPAANRTANAAPPKREALYSNGQLHWPKMPFSRSTPDQTKQAPAHAAQQARMMPRNTAIQNQPMAARQPNGISAASRAPIPYNQQHAAAMGGAHGAVNPAAPMNTQMLNSQLPRAVANSSAPKLNAPQSATAMPQAPKAPAAQESPAVRALAQAHEWSAAAQTDADFSRIIDICRQAQAGSADPKITQYANNLTAWALNRRGQLKAEHGHDKDALNDFNAAIQADARCWRATHNRGVLSAQAGEFEKAFDDFSRTIELNPKFAKAYSNRAALFVVAGNLEPATQDYEQAIAIDPELAVAHRGLGRACHLAGNLTEAIRHYDEAVRLSPNDCYAMSSRADVMTDLGRYAEANAEYEHALQMDPKSSHALSGSAWLLATCPDEAVRNPELAIERAQAAVELSGNDDAASLDTLAAAQANAGDFAAAKQSVEQAVQLASDSEKQSFEARLAMYQSEKPYRLAPLDRVAQAHHEEESK